jgi:hypothetical protein
MGTIKWIPSKMFKWEFCSPCGQYSMEYFDYNPDEQINIYQKINNDWYFICQQDFQVKQILYNLS